MTKNRNKIIKAVSTNIDTDFNDKIDENFTIIIEDDNQNIKNKNSFNSNNEKKLKDSLFKKEKEDKQSKKIEIKNLNKNNNSNNFQLIPINYKNEILNKTRNEENKKVLNNEKDYILKEEYDNIVLRHNKLKISNMILESRINKLLIREEKYSFLEKKNKKQKRKLWFYRIFTLLLLSGLGYWIYFYLKVNGKLKIDYILHSLENLVSKIF